MANAVRQDASSGSQNPAFFLLRIDHGVGRRGLVRAEHGAQLARFVEPGEVLGGQAHLGGVLDFADVAEAFDWRFCLTRQDVRKDYGELRYNMLVEFKRRVINITFNPRAGEVHLISVRPASREERKVYHAKNP